MTQNDQNEYLVNACRHAVRECMAQMSAPWEKLVLHVTIREGYRRNSGYFFDKKGEFHAVSADSDTMAALAQLQRSMAAQDGRRWLSCLLVIARSGAFDVQFEYDDPNRWRVSPDNLYKRIAEYAALPVPQAQALSQAEQQALLLAVCQSALIECGASLPDDWQKLVLCGECGDGHAGMFGYAFDASGDFHAASPRGNTLSHLEALHAAMGRGGERPWLALQIVIAVTGFFHVEYEYADAQRWKISPANLEARIAEFAALPVPG